MCRVLGFSSDRVPTGSSGVGDESSAASGCTGGPDGSAAVPDHGVDVQWQNTPRTCQQAEG